MARSRLKILHVDRGGRWGSIDEQTEILNEIYKSNLAADGVLSLPPPPFVEPFSQAKVFRRHENRPFARWLFPHYI